VCHSRSVPISLLAETVRSRRETKGLSREQLAVQAETSVATLVRLENYGKAPNLTILDRIARELGTTTAALLSPEPTEAPA
jgi:transcriptional regulator with XRE-family HTH domain